MQVFPETYFYLIKLMCVYATDLREGRIDMKNWNTGTGWQILWQIEPYISYLFHLQVLKLE